MFNFKVLKQSFKTLAREGEITTTHGKIRTPVFMPCATTGVIKGISPLELKELGYEIILANTYHLFLRPGDLLIKKMGGLQKFINWQNPILTDSGGYQVFSLGAGFRDQKRKDGLVEMTSSGVWFRSHLNGSKYFLTPEKAIDIQKNLGSDIVMVLDECTEYPVSYEKAKASMEKTHFWAQKSINYWQKTGNKKQAIFGIIQGSTYKDLREKSAKYISSMAFDGIAVGGVSVGEGKSNMHQVISWLGGKLPKEKPHYLMGVGEPEDIIFAVNCGFDMFDCVLPTRLGRHGTVWTTVNWRSFSKINLLNSKFGNKNKPIMKNCGCPACLKGFTCAYISYLFKEKEMLAMRLASLHNLYILKELTNRLRKEI